MLGSAFTNQSINHVGRGAWDDCASNLMSQAFGCGGNNFYVPLVTKTTYMNDLRRWEMWGGRMQRTWEVKKGDDEFEVWGVCSTWVLQLGPCPTTERI